MPVTLIKRSADFPFVEEASAVEVAGVLVGQDLSLATVDVNTLNVGDALNCNGSFDVGGSGSIDGILVVGTGLTIGGDLNIGSGKLTVDASSGDTTAQGVITGEALVAGTDIVAGTNVTAKKAILGDATVSGEVDFYGKTSGNTVALKVADSTASGTLTLPGATDTLVGRATTDTLTNKSIVATQLTGTIPFSTLRTGMIGQSLSLRRDYTGDISTTSSTYQAVTQGGNALELSITPNSSASKIRIRVTGGNSNANGHRVLVTLKRNIGGGGDTDLTPAGMEGLESILDNIIISHPHSIEFEDSPATTTATVYKVFFASADNTNTVYFHYWTGAFVPVIMVLEEIKQ